VGATSLFALLVTLFATLYDRYRSAYELMRQDNEETPPLGQVGEFNGNTPKN
jgi:hypothetical protein